jgi:hypothetical protein
MALGFSADKAGLKAEQATHERRPARPLQARFLPKAAKWEDVDTGDDAADGDAAWAAVEAEAACPGA